LTTQIVKLPHRTGVVGAGRMGSGIAHALLVAGSAVVLVEENESLFDGVREQLMKALQQSSDRGTLSEDPREAFERLTLATSTQTLSDVELVIEAVPEVFELKERVFASIEREVSPSTIIATNTSSLSVLKIATSSNYPERVIGLHFFNPVPSSQLIEIVRTEHNDSILIEQARGWVKCLNKTPIVVFDSPGFASSRLGIALGLEAIRMLEEGVASAEDIDTAMTLGYKHPMGPLRLTDLVGLDVRLEISKYLLQTLGPRFEPPELLIQKVSRGEFGRKSGQGFYVWPD